MRRQLLHAGAWTLATGAAVALSWFGVRTVLSGTAYDPPRALPVSQGARRSPPARPQASSTHRPRPSPTGTPSAAPSPHRPPPSAPAGSRSPRSTPPERPAPAEHGPTEAADGNVRGRSVQGGRAVFDMGADSADLVSATPEPGWDMRVWTAPTWIRVTFSRGGAASSVFCRWDDGPPRLETYPG